MTAKAIKRCDNKSVGIIVRNRDGSVAILKRALFPIGYAPVAGHVDADEHGGTIEQAAIDEVHEEIGLTITREDLRPTAIAGVRFNNRCRRPGGDYHDWWVFTVDHFEGTITPSVEETKGAGWYTEEQLRNFVDRTRNYQTGGITEEEWEADPGLEEMWVEMMERTGIIPRPR